MSGAEYRAWRERVGATIGEVADAAGVHYNTVQYIETGHRRPSPGMEFQLTHALRQLAEAKRP